MIFSSFILKINDLKINTKMKIKLIILKTIFYI